MAQITEDYVSFETAKLLKKKGFDSPCELQYINCSSGHPFLTDRRDDAGCYYKNSEIEQDEYSAPTLQMVMKWLRKEHGLHVIPRISRNTFLYGFKVVDNKGNIPCVNNFVFDSYEEACEAAIKYCLENLI